jgi:hypothetical protein
MAADERDTDPADQPAPGEEGFTANILRDATITGVPGADHATPDEPEAVALPGGDEDAPPRED